MFKELAWFAYKVSGVMCSVSACEHCWSIEGWIHSKRRNKLNQKLVERLVRVHTNLVLRETLDDALHLLRRRGTRSLTSGSLPELPYNTFF